jgi:phosphopantothenoylcysteine decarboxylase/phosphopantothenate--cysteine ligase
MAAAVADYRPAAPVEGKRPKDTANWTLELVPTVDVLRGLGGAKSNGQLIVAFGAEHGDAGRARKRKLLTDKNADLVVYNDVGCDGIGFDADDNEVTLISRLGERQVARAPKPVIAAAILDEVERLFGE